MFVAARFGVRTEVGVGPAVDHAGLHVRHVVGDEILAEAVALVDGGPECTGGRLPRHAHRIAQAGGEDALAATVRIELQDGRAPRVFAGVDVRGRADADVYL